MLTGGGGWGVARKRMAVQFEDYYQTLGVKRTSTQDEIQRAYRKLARQFHPDVNKSPEAAEKFRKVTEAYEVLKDPEKRKRYDSLGENWKAGQNFRPPPGFEGAGFGGRRPGGAGPGGPGGFSFEAENFSDFFETLFGSRAGVAGAASPFEEMFTEARTGRRSERAKDRRPAEAEITITLAEAMTGATKRLELQWDEIGRNGLVEPHHTTLDVKIPPGTTHGSVIRLRGEGPLKGTTRSDLHLKVNLEPDERFHVEGHDVSTVLAVSPWEAALGAKVPLLTPVGEVTLNIPAGSQAGQKLRLRGKGLPRRGSDDGHGDLLAEIRIVVPALATAEQKRLMQQLGEAFKDFDPRARRR